MLRTVPYHRRFFLNSFRSFTFSQSFLPLLFSFPPSLPPPLFLSLFLSLCIYIYKLVLAVAVVSTVPQGIIPIYRIVFYVVVILPLLYSSSLYNYHIR